MSEFIRGRSFTNKELNTIKRLTKKFFDQGRTRISVEVCKELDWRQANGWLKDRACREVLRKLEEKEYLALPPSKIKRTASKKVVKKSISFEIDETPIEDINFSEINLLQVKGTKNEKLWNWLVNKHHYLGFQVFVGRSLKYLIKVNQRVVGAIGWTDPAWSVAARDNLLKTLGLNKEESRLLGINNGRFLILPWVNVKNFASHLLSIATKAVIKDWSEYYSVEPLFLETFIDPSRYLGTCYKASNWILLGASKGYRKSGQNYHNSQRPKEYYIYPLKNIMRTDIFKYQEINKSGLRQ